MKQYFLQFDFWNKDINKFYYGVVYVDLNKTRLIDVCKQLIREDFVDIDPEEVQIKVATLNNIEF